MNLKHLLAMSVVISVASSAEEKKQIENKSTLRTNLASVISHVKKHPDVTFKKNGLVANPLQYSRFGEMDFTNATSYYVEQIDSTGKATAFYLDFGNDGESVNDILTFTYQQSEGTHFGFGMQYLKGKKGSFFSIGDDGKLSNPSHDGLQNYLDSMSSYAALVSQKLE